MSYFILAKIHLLIQSAIIHNKANKIIEKFLLVNQL